MGGSPATVRLGPPAKCAKPMAMVRPVAAVLVLALGAAGCGRKAPPPTPAPADEPKPGLAAAAQAPSAIQPSNMARPDPPGSGPCGALGCLKFPTALGAFQFVMTHEPLVLAIGEAHAQQGTEGIASSTKRFADELLPTLKGRSESLVLELWLASPSCGKVVETVRRQQKPVTETQAKSNPNEMIALGDRANALGIRPLPLKPSCADYAPIAAAGADAVPAMLELIARLSREKLAALAATAAPGSLVLAYGGAMHNDLAPAAGRERYTFGPALSQATAGRYVELDLIVGDYVKDAEPWSRLPWVSHYLTLGKSDATILYRPTPGAFVMVYPRTR